MPANTDESPLKDSSDYPRITQLEHEILGKTFVNEPVTQRLDQLERKAFGAPSTSDDLSARSDALERYANNHFPSSTQTAYNSGEDEVPAAAYGNNPVSSADFLHGHAAGDLAPSASLSQQVSWLETRVYGQNYPTDALVARVKRLQASIFPGDNNSKHETMPEQIHSMIGAVELAPSTPMASGVEQNQNQTLPSYAQPANASSYYTPPTNYEQPTYNGTPAPFSSSPPAYNNTASAYPGNQYAPNNQYPTQYPANNQYPANSQYQPQQQQSTQPVQSTHKSSLLHGLAHALGTVGSMALRSGMMMGPGMY
jgi:hypothetical protein